MLLAGGEVGSRGWELRSYQVVVAALAATVFFLAGQPAREALAVTFTVSQTGDAADPTPGDGICDVDAGTAGNQCSLRAAIQTANALGGSHIIRLPAGTYTLSVGARGENAAAGGDLDIIADITVRSADNAIGSVTIDANQLDRIFDVQSGGTLTVIGVTVTDGNSGGNRGGAIRSSGTLTLIGVTVSDSQSTDSGGGLDVEAGTASVYSSTFSGNTSSVAGGGIFTDVGSSLTLVNAFVSGNSAVGGGGLYTRSTASLTDTTIHNNQATGSDGGMFHAGGTLTMTRTTVSNNVAAGSTAGFTVSGVAAGDRGCPRRAAERVGRRMRAWQAGQATTRSSASSGSRPTAPTATTSPPKATSPKCISTPASRTSSSPIVTGRW